jgi:hypothetical protein
LAPGATLTRPDRPYSAFQAEARLSATTVKAGETLAYTLVNTGQYEVIDHAHKSLAAASAGGPTRR